LSSTLLRAAALKEIDEAIREVQNAEKD